MSPTCHPLPPVTASSWMDPACRSLEMPSEQHRADGGGPPVPCSVHEALPLTSQGALRVGGADSCDNPGPGPGHRRCSAKERDSVPSPGSLHPPALSGTHTPILVNALSSPRPPLAPLALPVLSPEGVSSQPGPTPQGVLISAQE